MRLWAYTPRVYGRSSINKHLYKSEIAQPRGDSECMRFVSIFAVDSLRFDQLSYSLGAAQPHGFFNRVGL